MLLHGWAGSAETWGPLAAALASGGRRTLAVDLPGWGASPAPRGFPHTPVAYASALAPLLREHAPVDVVAHSMGVQCALWAAAGLDGAVRRLVLVSPPVLPLPVRLRRPRTLAELVSVPVAGVPATRAAIAVMRRFPGDPRERWARGVADAAVLDRPEAAPLLAAAERSFAAPRTRDMARALRATARADMRPVAPRVAAPALVVAGARDRVVDPAEARILAGALPAARLLVVEDAGHLVHLERWDEVAAAALAHLGPGGAAP